MPYPKVLNPLGFISANLIIYWSGFDSLWKLVAAIFLGRIIYEVMLGRTDTAGRSDFDFRAASWIWPWFVGILTLSVMGRYGHGHNILPNWIDIGAVALFSLIIYYWAISLAQSPERVREAVRADEEAAPDPVMVAE
jgi:hypothetical protein